MPTTANVTFSNQYLTPVMDSEDARLIDVNIVASQTLARGTVLGETLGANGLAYLNITGAPTGGTFTLTYGAQTTAAIAYNALPEAIYTALAALSTIGAGNVAVTGTGPINLTPIRVELVGALANTVTTAITATSAGLTGGTSPTVVVTTVRNGSVGTPGTYKPYNLANTDGSQVARGFLMYDITTDASGNITITSTSGQTGNDLLMTSKATPMYVSGTFYSQDLTGFDPNAMLTLGAHLIEGNTSNGIVRIG